VGTKEKSIKPADNRAASPALPPNGGLKPGATGCYRSEIVGEATRIVVQTPGINTGPAFRMYCEYLSTLLHGQTTYQLASNGDGHSRSNWSATSHDLILYDLPEQRQITLQAEYIKQQNVRQEPPTILLVQQPCWPIRKILLVIRVEASETLAVDWAGRLAHLCGAQLTILPLVPSQALVSGPVSHLKNGVESLLTQNTPSGEQLRTFLQQLQQWQVNGTLRVRQGDPLWQICLEIDDGKYDLVIIGAEQHSRFRRLLFGELVCPLVNRINRPLMIAGRKNPQPQRLKPEQKMRDK